MRRLNYIISGLLACMGTALADPYNLAAPEETDLSPNSTPVTVYNWREDVGNVKKDWREGIANPGMGELPAPQPTSNNALHLSMREAILLALRNNPNIQSAGYDRVLDKFNLLVAHNYYEPNFTLGGTAAFTQGHRPAYNATPGATLNTSWGTQFAITSSSSFAGGVGPWNSTFTVTQPLLRGFGQELNTIPWYNALDNENAARLGYKGKIMAQVVAVISSYRLLVQDYQNIAIQKRTLESNIQTLKQSELKYKVGQLARSDLSQQKATYQTTKLAMLQQQSSLVTDYQNFLSALGLRPEAKISIDQNIDYRLIKIPPLEKCIELALKGNVEYQQALIAINAAKRAIISAKDATRVRLDLVGSASINNNNQNPQTVILAQPTAPGQPTTPGQPNPTNQIFPIQSSTGVAVNLTIPINDVKAKQGLVSAEVGLEKARLALQQSKLNLVRKITNEYQQISIAKLGVESAEQQVELQRQNLAAAQLKYRYGRTTVFEMNQIQDQYLSQATALITARIMLLNQITALFQDLGLTLDIWDIQLRY